MSAARIDLAHEPALSIGAVQVLPPTREVIAGDGTREVIEPRVMQVLVALARANGAMVSRDDLTHSCWEGRVVGEDAINRVISRLRRVAEGIGASSFRIETVTKVGYRLVPTGDADNSHNPGAGGDRRTAPQHPASPGFSRRRLVAAGALGVAAIATGLGWSRWHGKSAKPIPDNVRDSYQAGLSAYRQFTGDGELQARGLFRRVTELAPDFAPGWGMLAFVYANEVHYHAPQERAALKARAQAAIAQALALDSAEPRANVAAAMLAPLNKWHAQETATRAGLKHAPVDGVLLQFLSRTLARVGRMGEAADALQGAIANVESFPGALFDLMNWQWGAGRLDDADRTIARAMQMYPRNFAVWFGNFYINLYSGRVDQAIAMGEDVNARPASIPDAEIESVLRVAHAIKAPSAAAIDAIIDEQRARARTASGSAENAMQFAAALGRIDTAFEIANAYYLDRGFSVPEVRFVKGQGTYTPLADRRTWFLFLPSTEAMRRDPRFDKLLADIGLSNYWRESGTRPDYRRAG